MLRPLFLALCAIAFCALNSQAQTFKKLYDSTGCGLNYVTVSKKITDRHASGGAGAGLPATLALSGLPTDNCIEAAYVWIENSYGGGSPTAPNFSIKNPGGTTFNLPLSKIGQDKEKCWGEIGTRSWRADVTNAITVNGNYVINTNIPASEIDGLTMIVIYKDKSSTVTGNLVIYDGLQANNSGTNISVTVPMKKPCGSNLSGGKGFVVSGDFQLATHNAVINGQTNVGVDQFWSCDQAATTVTPGQTQMTFGAGPLSFDCFAVVAFGMFYVSDCGLPQLTVIGDQFLCSNGFTILSGSGAGCDTNYTWTYDDTTCFGDTVKITKSTTILLTSKCQTSALIPVLIRSFTNWNIATTPTNCGKSTGSITVTVNPPSPSEPIEYSLDGVNWSSSNTFGNLPPGTYTIHVRNSKGCTDTRPATISDNPGPVSIQSTQIPSTCNLPNGQIIITGVTGGTPTYQFSINGGAFTSNTNFNNLPAGVYSVKVRDANGCEYSSDFVVPATPPPSSVQASATNDICNQNIGTVTINGVTGGLAPYTYSINGSPFSSTMSMNPAPVGNYLIKAQDANNCQVQTTVTVSMINGPGSFTTNVQNSSCGKSDGQITVTGVTGGSSPYTYNIDGGSFGSSTSFGSLGAGQYLITVKDKNGCTVNNPSNIIDQGGPTATATTPSDALCGQSNGSVKIGAVSGGKSPYSFSFDGSTYGSTTTYSNLAPGPHAISVKDASGCILSINATVGNQTGQSGGVKSITHETCTAANGKYSVSNIIGGKTPYEYSLDGGNFGTSGSFSNLSAGAHTIVVRDANGCLLQLDSNLFNFAGPTGLNSVTSPEYCSDKNGSISVTSTTGGTAPIQYSIDNSTFNNANSFAGLTAGNYTIYLKDANNCPYNQPDVVQGFTGPIDLTFSHTPSTCKQPNGSLTVTGTTGGVAPYTYSIDNQSPTSSLSFSGIFGGKHNVEVFDANGCSYSEEYTVPDNGGPVSITKTDVQPTCGFTNGAIHISGASGGTAPYLYSVGGSSYTNKQSYTTLAPGLYDVKVKDATGCELTEPDTLVDLPGPDAIDLKEQNTTCSQSNGMVWINSVNGGSGGNTYSFNGGAFDTVTVFTQLPIGSYLVIVRDKNGCTLQDVIPVADDEGPTNFLLTPVNDKCTANQGKLTVSNVISGTAPFTYSLNAGSYQSSTAFNNLAAGNYTVTVKDKNGCTFSRQSPITDSPGPTNFVINSDSSSCGYTNGKLMAGSITGGTSPYKYRLGTGSFGPDSTFNALASGNYTVEIRDANNCLLSRPASIDNIAGPTDLNLSSNTSTCSSNNGSINVDQVIGGTAPYLYSIDGEQYHSATTFGNLLSSTYTIYVSDAHACLWNKKQYVPDAPSPVGFTETVTAENCKRVDGTVVIDQVNGGTAPFSYLINGLPFANTNSQDGLATGSYLIRIIDANGCEYSDDIDIPYFGYPKANFDLDPQVGENPLVVNFTNLSEDAVTYRWDFGTGDTSNAVNPYYTYVDSGNYVITLVAYNSAGCPDTAHRAVRAKMPTYVNIPNAFTPNNDGVNDYFNASTYGFKSFVMTLNTRWGDKIMEWNINEKGWNGDYLGAPGKEDVYVWVFVGTDIYGKKYRYTGHVSLLR